MALRSKTSEGNFAVKSSGRTSDFRSYYIDDLATSVQINGNFKFSFIELNAPIHGEDAPRSSVPMEIIVSADALKNIVAKLQHTARAAGLDLPEVELEEDD